MAKSKCIFCKEEIRKTFNNIIDFNNYGYVVMDNYPASMGHILIISKEHYSDWFSAPLEVQIELLKLANNSKQWIQNKYNPNGVNIGANCGDVTGQSVMHLHLHIIPNS